MLKDEDFTLSTLETFAIGVLFIALMGFSSFGLYVLLTAAIDLYNLGVIP